MGSLRTELEMQRKMYADVKEQYQDMTVCIST